MEAHHPSPPPRKISILLVKHVNILPFFSLLFFFHVECFLSDVPGHVVELTTSHSAVSPFPPVTVGDGVVSAVVELTASHSAVLFVPSVTVGDGAVFSVLEVTLLLTCTTEGDVWDDICKKTR